MVEVRRTAVIRHQSLIPMVTFTVSADLNYQTRHLLPSATAATSPPAMHETTTRTRSDASIVFAVNRAEYMVMPCLIPSTHCYPFLHRFTMTSSSIWACIK